MCKLHDLLRDYFQKSLTKFYVIQDDESGMARRQFLWTRRKLSDTFHHSQIVWRFELNQNDRAKISKLHDSLKDYPSLRFF